MEIEKFIACFTDHGEKAEVIDTFLNGCCYWFASILSERFNGEIVYDDVLGHFASCINGRYYDIRGDITDRNIKWTAWKEWDQPWLGISSARKAVIQGCINKV